MHVSESEFDQLITNIEQHAHEMSP